MAKKITYLLGAGASAYTIPVVTNFRQRLVEMKDFFYWCLPSSPVNIQKPFVIEQTLEGTLKEIIADINWLIDNAGNYFTIDTLAKKYYLSDKIDDLNKLKKCLIIYFTLEQLIFVESKTAKGYDFDKSPTDMRYDSFIAAISKKIIDTRDIPELEKISMELNGNIKVLSWNYDIQMELSLQRFLGKKIQYLKQVLQIFPHKESMYNSDAVKFDMSKFTMVKLNGNAIWDEVQVDTQPKESKYFRTIHDQGPTVTDNKTLLEKYLEKYKEIIEHRPSNGGINDAVDYFNFAWEAEKDFRYKYVGHDKNLEVAEKIASETEILVVIGYSFPIFNREIDKRLFNRMSKLEKVYIQDSHPDKIKSTMENAFEVLQQKKIVNRLTGNSLLPNKNPENPEIYETVSKVNIKLEDNTNQFVIPFGLT